MIELLENRLLLSSSPTVLATTSQTLSPQVAVDSQGDVFGTIRSSQVSAGAIYEVPAGSNNLKIIASFGPTGSTNTLGIDPDEILIDSNGNLFGTCESGGPSASGSANNALNPVLGGTIWELPAGSSTIQLIAGLSVQSNSDLCIDSAGDLFGFCAITRLPDLDSNFIYRCAPGGQPQFLTGDNSDFVEPTIAGVTCDPAGNVYIAYQDGPSAGFISEIPTGQDGSAETQLASLSGASYDPLGGIAADSVGNVYFNAYGSESLGDGTYTSTTSIEQIRAGSETVTYLGTLQTALNNYLGGNPILDPAGDIFSLGDGNLWMVNKGQSSIHSIYINTNTTAEINNLTFDASGTGYGTMADGSQTAIFSWQGLGKPASSKSSVSFQPTIVKSSLSSAVAGVTFHAALTTQLTATARPGSTGKVTIQVYAQTSGSSVLIGQGVSGFGKNTTRVGKIIRLSGNLSAGTYWLRVQSTTSSGNIENTIESGTLTVAPTFTDVIATVIAITPQVRVGSSGIVLLDLTNTGNIPAVDMLSVYLMLPAGQYTTILLEQALFLKILNNRRGVRIHLKFTVPSTVAAGAYEPTVEAYEDGNDVSTTSAKMLRVIQ